MTLSLTCDNCGSQLEIDESQVGKTIPCPQCQQPLTVSASDLADDLDQRVDDLVSESQAPASPALPQHDSPRSSDTPVPGRWSGLAPDGAPAQFQADVESTPSLSDTPHEIFSIELDAIAPDTLDEIAPDVPITTPPLKLSWILRHNRILLVVGSATLVCWLLTNAGTRYFPGGSLDVGAQAVALTTFGALLLVYGAVFCNLHTPLVKTIDEYLGKTLLALTAIWIAVLSVGAVRAANGLVSPAVAYTVLAWSVFGLLAWLSWMLFTSFGSLRVLTVQFALVAGLFVLATLPMSDAPTVDVISSMSGLAESFDELDRRSPGTPSPDTLPTITTPESDPFIADQPDAMASVEGEDVLSAGDGRPPASQIVDRFGHPTSLAGREDQVADQAGSARHEYGGLIGTDREGLPPPDAPEYFAELVRLLRTENISQRQNALRILNDVNPEDVSSREDRRLIARAYMDLALDCDRRVERPDGIAGIVKWGGTYSVPILLDILEEDYSPIKLEAYEALGRLQDARAALPVALRLGDAREHRAATRCLDAMGEAAEEGLIVAVPSEKTEVALTAIRLLQEHGTEQCVPMLRRMMRNRNLQIREAAKAALRCVRQRN